MAGRVSERAVLPPACHASVNEARITRETHVGTKAESLHYAGTHAFNEGVALLDETQHGLDAFGRLEIHRHGAFAAIGELRAAGVERIGTGFDAIHHDHVCAEIGEQHGAERTGADAGDFQNLEPGERTLSFCCHGWWSRYMLTGPIVESASSAVLPQS